MATIMNDNFANSCLKMGWNVIYTKQIDIIVLVNNIVLSVTECLAAIRSYVYMIVHVHSGSFHRYHFTHAANLET